MRKQSIVMLGLLCALLPATISAQTNVAGEWTMMFSTDQGDLPATLTLEQDGEMLTGELSSDQGTTPFEGTITGNMLKWEIEVDAGGAIFAITMEGTVEGDEMSGTADFGGYGGGDWSATRQ